MSKEIWKRVRVRRKRLSGRLALHQVYLDAVNVGVLERYDSERIDSDTVRVYPYRAYVYLDGHNQYGRNRQYVGTWSSVNGWRAAKKAAIGDFLAFVAKPEFQRPATIGAGSLSAFKSVGNPQPDDPNIGKILSWIDAHGTIAAGINLAEFAEIRLLRIPLMQAAILGERGVEETLAEMDKQINAVLNK